MPPQTIACEACLRRLPNVTSYQIGKPIMVTRVLNPDGHALYRHHSGGAISLCIAPVKQPTASEAARALAARRPRLPFTCEACGREYTAVAKRDRVNRACGETCRSKLWRAAQRAAKQANDTQNDTR